MKTAAFARATAVLAIAFTAIAVASPAAAAPPALPAGDTLFDYACDSEQTGDLQVFAVDVSNAATTPVGTATGTESACAYQGAWDYSTSTAWIMFENDDYNGSQIGTTDLTTGVTTSVAALTVSGAPTYFEAFTIDLDGNAWALDFREDGIHLFSVSLTDGTATDEGPLAAINDYVYGFAADPSNGLLYGLEQGGELFAIDPVAVTATSIGTAAFGPPYYYGLQIDSNGVAWFATYEYFDGSAFESALWSSSDLTTGEFSGVFTTGGVNYYTFSLLIAPVAPPAPPAPAALPNMGLDATPALVVGGLLLVAGGALVIARRRTASA